MLRLKSSFIATAALAQSLVNARRRGLCSESETSHGISEGGAVAVEWPKSTWNSNWDRREKKKKEAAAGEGERAAESGDEEGKKKDEEEKNRRLVHTLILVRHGQYVLDGKGDHGKVLTPLGREQAALTGKRIKQLVDGKQLYPIKYVYYSTMARATETAMLILPEIEAPVEHNVQPCSMIREGAVIPAFPLIDPKVWNPSEESFLKDFARVEAGFANRVHRADAATDGSSYSTLLVCHGNVIRYFVLR